VTLENLVETAGKVQMTEQDKEAQRRSFVFGNTKIANEMITRETVDGAAKGAWQRARRTAARSRSATQYRRW
jgi:hypothetical protein